MRAAPVEKTVRNPQTKRMSTLVPVEAERAISILEDTVEKLGFLDNITPDVLQHRDELSKFIGDEISKTLEEQKVLERRYEELIELRASMKGMINKNKYKEVQDEIQDVSRALRESTNNLVRSLKENPNVSGNLIKVQRDRIELHDLLLRANQELRDRGTYSTITHRVDEDNNAKLRFNQLKARENSLRETVNQLMDTLREEQRNFQRTVVEQRQAITLAKDELLSLKSHSSADAQFKKSESMATVSSLWRDFKLKQRVLEEKLLALEERLHTEAIVNADTKEYLTSKHKTLLSELDKWETKYEQDIGDMTRDITNITDQRNTLLENLASLKARKEEEILRDAALKEKEIFELAEAKKKRELLKRQNKAARRIQKEMRNFVKRKKEIEALGGGKKEKKGGKGKKK